MKALAAIVILIGISMPARAEFTGTSLVHHCSDPAAGPVDLAMCVAFVRGLWQGMLLGQPSSGPERKFCPPGSFNTAEAIAAIVAYLKENPITMTEDAGFVGVIVLQSKYPCPKPLGD